MQGCELDNSEALKYFIKAYLILEKHFTLSSSGLAFAIENHSVHKIISPRGLCFGCWGGFCQRASTRSIPTTPISRPATCGQ